MRWERLFTQPLVLALPLDHRLAERTEVALDEVDDEDFVMLRPLLGAARADRRPVPRGRLHASLGVRGRRPGRRTRLCGRRPRGGARPGRRVRAGETHGRERHLRITDAGAYREVGMAWPSERRLLPSAELFRRHVIERARRAKADAASLDCSAHASMIVCE